jgi:hypothetical protein
MTKINADDAPPRDDDDLEPQDHQPPPQTSLPTLILCFLNLAAVLGFAYLVVMDLGARNRWAYRVFLYDLAMQGLPLQEEAEGVSASLDSAPRLTLDPAWLAAAYKARKETKAVTDRFVAVDYVPRRIRPQDLEDDTLKEIFKEHGDKPVRTLEAETARLKKELPALLDAATADAGKKQKTAEKKRDRLYALLFPLAQTTLQVDALDQAVAATPAADLDALLVDVTRRRLIADVLALVGEFRPWKEDPLKEAVVLKDAKAGKAPLTPGRFKVPTEDLEQALKDRIDETVAKEVSARALLDTDDAKQKVRHEVEKRRTVAFLLLALSRVKGADGQRLYPTARAEVIVGTRELTLAADALALVLEKMQQPMLAAIQRDRGQYVYTLDYRIHDPALFADKLLALLERLGQPSKKGEPPTIVIPDDEGFKKAFKKDAEQRFADLHGKIRTDGKTSAGEQILREVKALLARHKIVIVEDKVAVAKNIKPREAHFDLEVLRLVNDRAEGFLGRHHEVVTRIRDLAARLAEQEERLQELTAQEEKLQKQYDARETQEKTVAGKLIAAREKTLRLSRDLFRLQDEVQRALIELADADRRNQLYERSIRQLERMRREGKQ